MTAQTGEQMECALCHLIAFLRKFETGERPVLTYFYVPETENRLGLSGDCLFCWLSLGSVNITASKALGV
jgi:hypothetical protein